MPSTACVTEKTLSPQLRFRIACHQGLTQFPTQVSSNGPQTLAPGQPASNSIQSPILLQRTPPATDTVFSGNCSTIAPVSTTMFTRTTSQISDLTRHTPSVSARIMWAVFIIGGSGSGKNSLADQLIHSTKVKNKRNYILMQIKFKRECQHNKNYREQVIRMQPGSFMPSLPKLKKDCYNSQEKKDQMLFTRAQGQTLNITII